MRAHSGLVSAVVPLVLTACTDPSVSVRAELMRLPDVAAATTLHSAAASVPPWTSQVTVTSVRAPITEIVLRGPGVSVVLYDCPGATSADCLVELNSPALQNLVPTDPVSGEPGTYEDIEVGYCVPGETGWNAHLTGSTTIGGTTYYTRTIGNLSTSGPAQPVSLPYTGCGAAFAIEPPLVITDTAGIAVLLRLYFDIRDIAYAALTDATTNGARGFGCTGPASTGFVCAAYTTIIAIPGTALPTIERYRVNANVTIGLAFDAADRFVGGYNRRYYIEDAGYAPGIGGEGHYDIMTPSGPGTYRLTSSHGGNDFPAFQRASHSGTVSVPVGGPTPIITIPYTAVRLP
jgi:hypothetical protein